MATALNNVNFQLLLQQHGGDLGRARAAWQQILHLGRFGDVPFEYEGGLDVQSLRVLLEERQQKQPQAEVRTIYQNMVVPLPNAQDEKLEDRIKQIEDIASGDQPKEN